MARPGPRTGRRAPGSRLDRDGTAPVPRAWRRAAFAVLLAAAPGATFAQPAAEPEARPPLSETLTLERALSLALQNNPSVRSAALEVDRSEQSLGGARTQRLPTLQSKVLAGEIVTPLQITVPGGSLGTFPTIGPIPSQTTVIEAPRTFSVNASATLAQPISQIYKVGLAVKIDEATREIDREKLRQEKLAVTNEVKRLYYGILQTQSAAAAAEDQVRTYRELDRVVSEYVARETALLSDGLDVKSGLAQAEYRLVNLENTLATQKEQMNDLLGREIEREFEVVAVPEPPSEEIDLDSAVSRALERRPEIHQARLQIDQAEAARRLERADYIPDLSFVATYLTFTNADLLPRNLAHVGLMLEWQPLDWGRRRRDVTDRALQLEQARIGEREAESRIRIDVASRFRALQESRLLLEASRLSRESAREKVRVATARFENHAALLKDVLQAQASLGDAESRYQQALGGFWTARAEFENAIGEEL